MTEFITGLVLGGLLVFFTMEFHRWKSRFIADRQPREKNTENAQWHNLMNYDGSERGQTYFEN